MIRYLAILFGITTLSTLIWPAGAVHARPGQPDTPVTVNGTVVSFKYAPRGEIDGFYLDSGVEVRTPKHWEWELSQTITVGSPVQVDGRQRIGRRGEIHVKAQVITNLTTNARLVIEEVVNLQGQVVNYTYSRSGRIDGFVLTTGDEVRTPPHLSATISNMIPVGSPVQVSGVRKTGKYGDVHVKPDTITDLATGTVIVIP
ncbi:hypothetical protein [Chloroflexus aurantiacus]